MNNVGTGRDYWVVVLRLFTYCWRKPLWFWESKRSLEHAGVGHQLWGWRIPVDWVVGSYRFISGAWN
jgi:hypothetical protein